MPKLPELGSYVRVIASDEDLREIGAFEMLDVALGGRVGRVMHVDSMNTSFQNGPQWGSGVVDVQLTKAGKWLMFAFPLSEWLRYLEPTDSPMWEHMEYPLEVGDLDEFKAIVQPYQVWETFRKDDTTPYLFVNGQLRWQRGGQEGSSFDLDWEPDLKLPPQFQENGGVHIQYIPSDCFPLTLVWHDWRTLIFENEGLRWENMGGPQDIDYVLSHCQPGDIWHVTNQPRPFPYLLILEKDARGTHWDIFRDIDEAIEKTTLEGNKCLENGSQHRSYREHEVQFELVYRDGHRVGSAWETIEPKVGDEVEVIGSDVKLAAISYSPTVRGIRGTVHTIMPPARGVMLRRDEGGSFMVYTGKALYEFPRDAWVDYLKVVYPEDSLAWETIEPQIGQTVEVILTNERSDDFNQPQAYGLRGKVVGHQQATAVPMPWQDERGAILVETHDVEVAGGLVVPGMLLAYPRGQWQKFLRIVDNPDPLAWEMIKPLPIDSPSAMLGWIVTVSIEGNRYYAVVIGSVADHVILALMGNPPILAREWIMGWIVTVSIEGRIGTMRDLADKLRIPWPIETEDNAFRLSRMQGAASNFDIRVLKADRVEDVVEYVGL